MFIQYTAFDVNFLVPTRLLMKEFCCSFLYGAFHAGVCQRSHKLILHKKNKYKGNDVLNCGHILAAHK